MNAPDDAAISTAIARPARPMSRNERTKRPRSANAMKTRIPRTAKNARPASWVASPTVSSRWKRPAVDQAIAASVT